MCSPISTGQAYCMTEQGAGIPFIQREGGGGSLRRRREGGREGEKERWRSGSVQVILFGVGDRVRTNRGGCQWPGF